MPHLTDGLLCDDLNDPGLIAVVEDGRVADLWGPTQTAEPLGSVHLVRVTARHPQHRRLSGQLASGAVVSWPMKPEDKSQEGMLAVVTLTAAARQDKAIQAVAGIELAGRYTVLRQQSRRPARIQLSRKAAKQITDDGQTNKLIQLAGATSAVDKGFDVIFRRSAIRARQPVSAALGDNICAEIEGLLAGWSEQADMPDDVRTVAVPRPVYGGGSLGSVAKHLYPNLSARLLGPADWPVVQIAYDEARQKRYDTDDGAVLWFEQTRAAVMVDIDSAGGKLGPDRLCFQVLPDLFRQLRLRRLAGKILVDVPYLASKNRAGLLAEIDHQASCDPRYPDCLGFTRSGLLELSVRHSRPVLDTDQAFEALMEHHARRQAL